MKREIKFCSNDIKVSAQSYDNVWLLYNKSI
jgi:hypothetical protein